MSSGAPIPTRPGSPTASWSRAVATVRRSTSSTRSTARRCSRSTAVSSLAARRTPSTSGRGPTPPRISTACSALPTGEVAFGAAFSNGLLRPWASGPAPDTALAENPRLAGTVRWSGRLLGLTPAAEAVAGVADLAVHLDSLDGDLNFTGLEYWPEGAAPGAVGTGSTWRDGDLGYRVEVRGNTFLRASGDTGTVDRRVLRTRDTRAWVASSRARTSRPGSAVSADLCLPFISSGVHQERRPVRRHW